MDYQYNQETCPEHDFQFLYDSMSGRDVVCLKCGMPGDKDERTGEVYFPAT